MSGGKSKKSARADKVPTRPSGGLIGEIEAYLRRSLAKPPLREDGEGLSRKYDEESETEARSVQSSRGSSERGLEDLESSSVEFVEKVARPTLSIDSARRDVIHLDSDEEGEVSDVQGDRELDPFRRWSKHSPLSEPSDGGPPRIKSFREEQRYRDELSARASAERTSVIEEIFRVYKSSHRRPVIGSRLRAALAGPSEELNAAIARAYDVDRDMHDKIRKLLSSEGQRESWNLFAEKNRMVVDTTDDYYSTEMEVFASTYRVLCKEQACRKYPLNKVQATIFGHALAQSFMGFARERVRELETWYVTNLYPAQNLVIGFSNRGKYHNYLVDECLMVEPESELCSSLIRRLCHRFRQCGGLFGWCFEHIRKHNRGGKRRKSFLQGIRVSFREGNSFEAFQSVFVSSSKAMRSLGADEYIRSDFRCRPARPPKPRCKGG